MGSGSCASQPPHARSMVQAARVVMLARPAGSRCLAGCKGRGGGRQAPGSHAVRVPHLRHSSFQQIWVFTVAVCCTAGGAGCVCCSLFRGGGRRLCWVQMLGCAARRRIDLHVRLRSWILLSGLLHGALLGTAARGSGHSCCLLNAARRARAARSVSRGPGLCVCRRRLTRETNVHGRRHMHDQGRREALTTASCFKLHAGRPPRRPPPTPAGAGGVTAAR